MEETTVEKKQDEPVKEKKVYTAPVLSVYGKLTELTAAGTKYAKEDTPGVGNDFRS